MTTRYAVDADIARAATLDAAFYRDDAAWEAVRDRVFARSWQWLGDLADVAAPGSLSPRGLARDREGTLRCLSNVCTHRGNLLVREACGAREIRCGYHSRRFDLAGRVTFMPGFGGVQGFPSPADDLPEVALAHWALYVENYLEGFHIPFVHPALAAAIDCASYETKLHRYSSVQVARASPGTAAFRSADPGIAPIAARYWWIFPNLMVNAYPWGLSFNLVLPVSPERTRVAFRSYVADASTLETGAGGNLDAVEREDEAIVEAVQRGVRSRLYRGSRYSPSRERGVHHFHRLLGEFLRSPSPAASR